MPIKKMSEHEHQVMLVQWLKRNHPGLRFFSVPNAAKRSYNISAMMKAEGLSKGVPDFFIPKLKLFIEMKAEQGRLSKEQVSWLEYLGSVGYTSEVCYGFEEARELIEGLLND